MSLFGEIVEPGSRNAWEDWDQINSQEDIYPKLQWEKEFEVPTEIKSLFILEGQHIADSVTSHAKIRLEQVNAIHEVNVKLYRTVNTNVYVCVLRDYDLLLASEIVELIKPYVTASSNIVAILTKPIAEYQTTEYINKEYVLRSLSTSTSQPLSLTSNIPKLEQPNIISGVTAGVINLREIMNQSGAAIVCYMEHNEEYQINELQELLNKLNFGPVQPKPNIVLNSNLYI